MTTPRPSPAWRVRAGETREGEGTKFNENAHSRSDPQGAVRVEPLCECGLCEHRRELDPIIRVEDIVPCLCNCGSEEGKRVEQGDGYAIVCTRCGYAWREK